MTPKTQGALKNYLDQLKNKKQKTMKEFRIYFRGEKVADITEVDHIERTDDGMLFFKDKDKHTIALFNHEYCFVEI